MTHEEEWDIKVAQAALWQTAREYYLSNKAHEFPQDNRLEVCVESNSQNDMTAHCWAILESTYPQGE
jgi:hypothetical protein